MKLIKALGAALLALSFATGSAPAMPQAPAVSRDTLVTKVAADCHQEARLHYLPEDNREVWHRHRQEDCRIVVVDPPQGAAKPSNGAANPPQRENDCHQDARLHFLPQDGRKVWHRHRQSDCKVVLVDPPQQEVDCHQDARLHYLSKYG